MIAGDTGANMARLAAARIAASAQVSPSIPGLAGTLTGLGVIGAAAIALDAAGATDSFLHMRVPPFLTAVGGKESEDGAQSEVRVGSNVLMTLARTLIIPGLAEEAFWRVALFPHPAVDAGLDQPGGAVGALEIHRILLVNAAFTLYHPFGADVVTFIVRFLLRRKVEAERIRRVFRSPSFLLLAFVLGNACTLAYRMSGHALYAPVMVHGIAVALWMDWFGGEEALRGDKSVPTSSRGDKNS